MSSTDGSNDFDSPADGLGLLPPDESLDTDEFDEGIDDTGYSPLDRRSGNLSWGLTAREARTSEPLSARLAREVPDLSDSVLGDGLGDSIDTDGELIDNQVGYRRAGRLMFADPSNLDQSADYLAIDAGIDGGAASAEEAAIHIVLDDGDLR